MQTINTHLATIEATMNTHTTALDQLLKEKKDRDEENAASAQRFSRLEQWAEQVGTRLGIKLER